MKKLFFAAAMLVVTNVMAQESKAGRADAIMRIWETQTKDGKMQILNPRTPITPKCCMEKTCWKLTVKPIKET